MKNYLQRTGPMIYMGKNRCSALAIAYYRFMILITVWKTIINHIVSVIMPGRNYHASVFDCKATNN